MNSFYLKLYNLYQRVGSFIEKKATPEKVAKYKKEHGQQLSMAEEFLILKDIESTIYGDMTLSEYIAKWGTIYIDEKFLPLLKREKPVRELHGLQFNRFRKEDEHLQTQSSL